jgi:tetratricopeptide (TPR) repeat protein
LADTDQFQEKVGYQSLAIHNPSQAPFLVKISYHPNWRVQGAARINLASPAFMLIFPEEPKVELRFTSTWPNHLGLALTIAGLLILLLNLPLVRNLSLVKHVSQKAAALEQRIGRHLEQWLRRPLTWLETRSLVIGVISLLVLAGLLGLYLGLGGKEDASMAYGRAHRAYAAQDYSRAAILFAQALEKRPLSPVADHTAMHLGFSLYKQKLYAKALKAFRDVLDRFPESRLVPEARYHMGLCLRGLKRPQEAVKEFEELISAFPQTAWADYAGQKLREIKKTESNLPQ